MSYYRYEKTKTYKWRLLHIDDGEEEAIFFKTKADAYWHLETATGFMLTKEE